MPAAIGRQPYEPSWGCLLVGQIQLLPAKRTLISCNEVQLPRMTFHTTWVDNSVPCTGWESYRGRLA